MLRQSCRLLVTMLLIAAVVTPVQGGGAATGLAPADALNPPAGNAAATPPLAPPLAPSAATNLGRQRVALVSNPGGASPRAQGHAATRNHGGAMPVAHAHAATSTGRSAAAGVHVHTGAPVHGGAAAGVPRAVAAGVARAALMAASARVPLSFEQNRGQVDASVSYLAHGQGYTAYLTADALTLALAPSITTTTTTTLQGVPEARGIVPALAATAPPAQVVRFQLEGAGSAAPVAQDPLPGVVNYLIGSDPTKWHTDIPTFGQVTYPNVYPGVDLVYHGQQRDVAFDFTVHPGAQVSAIRFRLAGADSATQDAQGNLEIQPWERHADGGGAAGLPAGRWAAPLVGSHYQLLSMTRWAWAWTAMIPPRR